MRNEICFQESVSNLANNLKGVPDVVDVVELLADPVEGHRDEAVVVGDENRSGALSIWLHSG